EDVACFLPPAAVVGVGADLVANLCSGIVGRLAHEFRSDLLARVGECDVVVHPLPDLRAGDLRGRRVFHQVVNRGGAVAAQPRLDVADADVNVRAQTGAGDGARSLLRGEQHVGGDVDLGSLLVDLVG